MIIEINACNYKGILISRVEDQGWKCNLGGQEYVFPNYVAAQKAINEIFRDIKPIVTKNKGKKYLYTGNNSLDAPTKEELIDALEEKFYAILRSGGVHERHDEIMSILDDIITLQDS